MSDSNPCTSDSMDCSVESINPCESASNVAADLSTLHDSGLEIDTVARSAVLDLDLIRTPGSSTVSSSTAKLNETKVAMDSGIFFNRPDGKQSDLAVRKLTLPCLVCRRPLKVQSNNFSSMIMHAKSKHPVHWDRAVESLNMPVRRTDRSSQPKITSMIKRAPPKSYSKKDMRNALVEWIVADDQSFRVVQHPNFRRFCETMNPIVLEGAQPDLWKSPQSAQKAIIQMYHDIKAMKKADIAVNSSKLSLSTDIWTSPAQTPFMAVTGHYIDNNWKLQTVLLDFVPFPGEHSGLLLASKIREVLKDWNIESPIMGMTVDGASNNTSMTDALEETGHVEFGFHFRCFAHALNLACKEGIKCFDEKFAKIRKYIKAVRFSPKKHELLKEKFRVGNNFVGYFLTLLL